VQLLNIEAKLVPSAVLNKGTVSREVQPLNIPLKPVPDTFTVLNKGTSLRDLQLSNMELTVVAFAVLNKGTV
jgi:hypothetical protein